MHGLGVFWGITNGKSSSSLLTTFLVVLIVINTTNYFDQKVQQSTNNKNDILDSLMIQNFQNYSEYDYESMTDKMPILGIQSRPSIELKTR